MEFDTFLARTLIYFDISLLAKRGKRREQMTDCDEKLADEQEFTASNDASDRRRRRRRRGEEKEVVGRGGKPGRTKEGEEALRFFRGRDFETCLSALKSRKIKETEAKAGRACLGGLRKTRRILRLPKGRGAEGARNTRRMARQARREVRQKVVHTRTAIRSRSCVRSSYSCSFTAPRLIRSSYFTPFLRLPPSTFHREECAIYEL